MKLPLFRISHIIHSIDFNSTEQHIVPCSKSKVGPSPATSGPRVPPLRFGRALRSAFTPAGTHRARPAQNPTRPALSDKTRTLRVITYFIVFIALAILCIHMV